MSNEKQTTVSVTQIQEERTVPVFDKFGEDYYEDINISTALGRESKDIPDGYFSSIPLIASIFASSFGCLATIWVFVPAASIISFIAGDMAPSDNASLFAIICSLASPISALCFGRLSDRLGRRWFVIGGNIVGIIGAIIAGTSQSMNQLIVANVFLRLATGIQICYLLTVGELVPHNWKFVVIVLVAIPNVIPSGFGGYLGRRIYETSSWKWIYWSYIVILAPAIFLQLFFYHPPNFRALHGPNRSRMSEFKRIDFTGNFPFVTGLFCFLLGTAWGGQPASWTSAKILGLIISGGAGLIAFVLWEIYAKIQVPLVPMRLFGDIRGFCVLCVLSALSGIAYIGPSIMWPAQVQTLYSTSTTPWQTTAWCTTTVNFEGYAGIVLFSPLMTVIKHFKWQAVVACAFSVAFVGALSQLSKSDLNQGLAFSFLSTVPIGWLEPATGLLIQLIVDDADVEIAFAIVLSFRLAFGAVGTAVYVAILQGKVPKEIQARVIPAALAACLPATSLPALFGAISTQFQPEAVAEVKGLTPDIILAVSNALLDAYSVAYAYVYYASMAFSGFALVVSFFTMDYDKLFTGQVSRQIEKLNGIMDIKIHHVDAEKTTGQ